MRTYLNPVQTRFAAVQQRQNCYVFPCRPLQMKDLREVAESIEGPATHALPDPLAVRMQKCLKLVVQQARLIFPTSAAKTPWPSNTAFVAANSFQDDKTYGHVFIPEWIHRLRS